ncbi:hypothetical protein D779_2353 [Imhoffiella purpurea]|uniref:Uncharacterized protein n=1 Tax=Imhoffiella purpurea TaxID=1249627 RepID=W9VC55_9GAMM|nr:hypothetical protein D779_2353 [Imhoffiella purpurea]
MHEGFELDGLHLRHSNESCGDLDLIDLASWCGQGKRGIALQSFQDIRDFYS